MTLRSQSARESNPHQTAGTADGIKPQLQCGIQHALISVIITTYNRTDALNAVLRALAAQTDRGFEVVIADDGSDQRTAQLVEAWSASFARLGHVWHEHRNFRAAEIRNRAILQSCGELCVFLDGDCIPRPNFIQVHRRLAEPGWFVAGNRVLLSRQLTELILADHLEPERWALRQWVEARLRGDINRLQPLLSLPLGPLRRMGGAAWRSIRSANLAIGRADLLRVDGFDAAFSGWGREDSTSCFGSCIAVRGGRMDDLPPRCCISGTPKMIARACR